MLEEQVGGTYLNLKTRKNMKTDSICEELRESEV